MLAVVAIGIVAAAIGVAAPAGPDDGCPSPRQVIDALTARLAGTVIPVGQPIGSGALKLMVATDTAGVTRVDLVDPGGQALLHRTLLAPERPRVAECPALADTVALIVERYWREVGFDVPPLPPPRPPTAPPPPPPVTPPPAAVEEHRPAAPPPPPPPPGAPFWSLGPAIAGRIGDTGGSDLALSLAFGLQRAWGLRVSAGASSSADADTVVGRAGFRRFPVRLGGYWPVHLAVGQLEPGLGVGVEVIAVELTRVKIDTTLQSNTLCSGRFCLSPGADISLGWAVRPARHLYLRALARAGLAVPYAFGTSPDGAVWSTPRTYLEVGIESGIWFN